MQGLRIGDSFIFAGRVLEFAGMKANQVLARPGQAREPKIPAYAGGRLPLSPGLAKTVRQLLNDPKTHKRLPPMVQEWLSIQTWVSDCRQRSGC